MTDKDKGLVKTVPPDLWLVRIDHDPDWWTDKKFYERAKPIYTIYLVDRSIHFHLCEITPSYELRKMYTDFEGPPGFGVEEREAMFEKIQEAEIDDEEFEYHHVSEIDRLIERNPSYAKKVEWEKAYDWKDPAEYKDGVEDTREWAIGNCPL